MTWPEVAIIALDVVQLIALTALGVWLQSKRLEDQRRQRAISRTARK
jgi:predicted permease